MIDYLDKIPPEIRDNIVTYCKEWRDAQPIPAINARRGKPHLFIEDFPGGIEKLLSLAALGYSLVEIAGSFGVSLPTLRKWRKQKQYFGIFQLCHTYIGAKFDQIGRQQLQNPDRAFSDRLYNQIYALRQRAANAVYSDEIDPNCPEALAKGMMAKYLNGDSSAEELQQQLSALSAYGGLTVFKELKQRLSALEAALGEEL